MIQNEYSNEKMIINYIDIVTQGIINDLKISNMYASWKNTSKGLNFIRNDKDKFYLGVKMWLDITQNQIIGVNDYNDLVSLCLKFIWIEKILLIRDLYSEFDPDYNIMNSQKFFQA